MTTDQTTLRPSLPTKQSTSEGYTLNDWRALGGMEQVGDHSLFVIDSGAEANQDVIVLIHGFPTSSWDWHKQWDALCARYRVIAMDLLGFGYSDKPRQRYSIHEQADLVLALLAARGVSRCALLAHDYGDTVAQEILARCRQQAAPTIVAACLLNGGLFPETHRARFAQKLLVGPAGGLFVRLMGRAALERNLTAVFGRETPPSQTELDNFWQLMNYNNGRSNMHRLMWYIKDRRVHRERWLDALRVSTVPLALINGSSDPVSGAHMVARYRELVGRGTIIELPTIGHYPQLEAPDAVTRHALTFFEETV
ncbi:MAG: alpha/beta hydrolase [Pseudomonadota bacterium]